MWNLNAFFTTIGWLVCSKYPTLVQKPAWNSMTNFFFWKKNLRHSLDEWRSSKWIEKKIRTESKKTETETDNAVYYYYNIQTLVQMAKHSKNVIGKSLNAFCIPIARIFFFSMFADDNFGCSRQSRSWCRGHHVCFTIFARIWIIGVFVCSIW